MARWREDKPVKQGFNKKNGWGSWECPDMEGQLYINNKVLKEPKMIIKDGEFLNDPIEQGIDYSIFEPPNELYRLTNNSRAFII